MLKLFRHLRPFASAVAAALALVLLQSLAELYLPTLMSDIVDIGILRGDTSYILRIGGRMLLVTAAGAACAVAASYLSARIGMGFGRDLRRKIFARVEGFSLHEFDRIGTPSLITRTTNDITQVQMFTTVAVRMMAGAPIMAVGGVVLALQEDARLTWVLVAVIPLIALAVSLLAWRTLPLFRCIQAKLDRINLVLRENLTGVRVVRAFDRIAHEQGRFDAANRDLTETSLTVNRIMALMMPLMMLLMNFTSIALIWFGARRIDLGGMQIGSLLAFIQYAMQILFSLLMLSFLFVMLPRASASAGRLNEVFALSPAIRDPAVPLRALTERGHLELRGVSFRYPGAEEPAVRDVSFDARPGEVTAIIGGTGAGKSTIANLIPRFYDVEQGAILVDGVDIRRMSQEDLHRKIGFVPQKAVLFQDTIGNNIRWGREQATEEEVARAAEAAQLAEFLGPEGLAAPVSQGGTNLSGGQKQRLAIARALVRKPEIYVFDDAFSALDFRTDARLRAALRRWTAEATVLIVTQRVNPVLDADRVVVLDEGRLVGVGSHPELMRSCQVYREIVDSQLSGEKPA